MNLKANHSEKHLESLTQTCHSIKLFSLMDRRKFMTGIGLAGLIGIGKLLSTPHKASQKDREKSLK